MQPYRTEVAPQKVPKSLLEAITILPKPIKSLPALLNYAEKHYDRMNNETSQLTPAYAPVQAIREGCKARDLEETYGFIRHHP